MIVKGREIIPPLNYFPYSFLFPLFSYYSYSSFYPFALALFTCVLLLPSLIFSSSYSVFILAPVVIPLHLLISLCLFLLSNLISPPYFSISPCSSLLSDFISLLYFPTFYPHTYVAPLPTSLHLSLPSDLTPYPPYFPIVLHHLLTLQSHPHPLTQLEDTDPPPTVSPPYPYG